MSAASRERFADIVRAGGAAGDPADVRLDRALLMLSAETQPDDEVSGIGLDEVERRWLAELDDLAESVPDEGRDDSRLRAVLGGFQDSTPPPADPNAPTLVVRGWVLMGGIDVKNESDWREGATTIDPRTGERVPAGVVIRRGTGRPDVLAARACVANKMAMTIRGKSFVRMR